MLGTNCCHTYLPYTPQAQGLSLCLHCCWGEELITSILALMSWCWGKGGIFQ